MEMRDCSPLSGTSGHPESGVKWSVEWPDDIREVPSLSLKELVSKFSLNKIMNLLWCLAWFPPSSVRECVRET